jgi:aspartate aminotransferase
LKLGNSAVNLFFISGYQDEDGKPWVLPFVLRIENEMISSATYNHEYVPFLGLDLYRELVPPTVLGENSAALRSGRVSIDYLVIYICRLS